VLEVEGLGKFYLKGRSDSVLGVGR
jgi:hypothetical protein